MRWICASDLERWATSIPARDQLPQIVSDLIRASAQDIASIRFPSGDKGQVRGFDGSLYSSTASINVPEGQSYWEFGVGKDYQTKGATDFDKRTKETSADEQKLATYVFVSPRAWDSSKPSNKLEDFVSAQKSKSHWKDVRFIDAVALEAWLDENPAVAAWHARNTIGNMPPQGVRSIDEFWAEFSGKYTPPLSEDVVLCERLEAIEPLTNKLLQSGTIEQLISDSPDEAIAFAVACIRRSKPEIRLFLESRVLIVDSADVARQLPRKGRLVLFLRNDAARSPTQYTSIGSVLVPLGRQQIGTGATRLTRPSNHSMATALKTMGFDESKSNVLARGCGRSLTALARLIPSGRYDSPEWTRDGTDLLPAFLAGAWDSTHEADNDILTLLADGRKSSDIEKLVRIHLKGEDPPFDLEGTVWKVRAPMDAFIHIGPLIRQEDCARLRDAIHRVFSHLPEEDQADGQEILAPKVVSEFSGWLRDGLANTLLMLAVWSEVAQVSIGAESGQHFANRVIEELPGLKTNPRILTSLEHEIPMLAEAAPDPLLSALEHMLEGENPIIRAIFQEAPSWLHPISRHNGVLWALERLAWDPEHLMRATKCLARLAEIDPGGSTSNRPINSLANVFLAWYPCTYAHFAQRQSVLLHIVERYPSIAWALVTRLLPKATQAAMPTARPQLRDAGASSAKAVTRKELNLAYEAVCDCAIQLAHGTPDRWIELVPHLHSFPVASRNAALEALEKDMEELGPKEREQVWKKVRDEVLRHKKYSVAAWSLKGEQIRRYEQVVDRFKPDDPIPILLPLFTSWSVNWTEDSDENKARLDAVRMLYDMGGALKLVDLAMHAERAYAVAGSIERSNLSQHEIKCVLAASAKPSASSGFAGAMSDLYARKFGTLEAVQTLIEISKELKLTARETAALIWSWPTNADTWKALRKFDPEVAHSYWRNKPAAPISGPRLDLIKAVLKLLRCKRSFIAIQSTWDRRDELPSKLYLRMIESLSRSIMEGHFTPDSMTGYHVGEIFEILDERNDVPLIDIACLEYKLYPLIKHEKRSKSLYRLMSSNPEFFHFILRNVYRNDAEMGEPIDEEKRANAQLSFEVLYDFDLLPGLDGEDIDAETLTLWVDAVRRLGRESGIDKVSDGYVGKILANAPADCDGGWPHRKVRYEIERLASDEIERAIELERYNLRGVTTRGLYEGGDQERALAETARRDSSIAVDTPRTAAMLRRIEKSWIEEAKREDVEAAKRKLMD